SRNRQRAVIAAEGERAMVTAGEAAFTPGSAERSRPQIVENRLVGATAHADAVAKARVIPAGSTGFENEFIVNVLPPGRQTATWAAPALGRVNGLTLGVHTPDRPVHAVGAGVGRPAVLPPSLEARPVEDAAETVRIRGGHHGVLLGGQAGVLRRRA